MHTLAALKLAQKDFIKNPSAQNYRALEAAMMGYQAVHQIINREAAKAYVKFV
jgi:hypothetical protein